MDYRLFIIIHHVIYLNIKILIKLIKDIQRYNEKNKIFLN